jgi:hypothetical protein
MIRLKGMPDGVSMERFWQAALTCADVLSKYDQSDRVRRLAALWYDTGDAVSLWHWLWHVRTTMSRSRLCVVSQW